MGDIDQVLRLFVSILVGYKYDEAQLRNTVPALSLAESKVEAQLRDTVLALRQKFFYLLTNSDISRIATTFRCMRIYVSVTKCPLALWFNFNIACEEEYIQEKVMKCPPNYTPQ